ncbi:MAG: PEP/pyruvate-binding domain-containing protein [Candidatus Sericytochromatia bacterium]
MARNPSSDAISTESNIVWLQDVTPRQLELVGCKALNLGVATRLRLPVGPGFVITTRAYRSCLEQMGFSPEQLRRLSQDEIQQLARTIQHYFMKQAIPSELLTEIRAAYKQLVPGKDSGVVIRPSVAYPNGVDFAKRLRPILGVKSLIELEKSLKMAWAYMWLDDIIHYRFSQPHLNERWDDLALLIQPLQIPFVSGSLLSYHPESDEQSFVIEAARGLNEAVSRGVLVPDRYIWQRFLKKISQRDVVSKPLRFVMAEQGAVQEVPVEASQREQPALNEADVVVLADHTEKLVAAYQRPLEIEWFKTGNGLQLLQITPIRKPNFESVRSEDWRSPHTLLPYFDKPFSPLGWSFYAPLLHHSLMNLSSRLGFAEGALPEEPFRLQDHTLLLHPGIFTALDQQLQQYWGEVEHLSPLRRLFQFVRELLPLQREWQRHLRQFCEQMQQEWQRDYDNSGAEPLLAHLQVLSQQGQLLFDQLLLVRVLNHLCAVFFADFAQHSLPANGVYDILFQGLPSRLGRSGALLDQYAESILQQPEWVRLFRQQNPHHIVRALQMDEQGQRWLKQLEKDFHHSGFFRIGLEPLYPSWVEAPQMLIRELQQAVIHPERSWDEGLLQQREALERELASGFDWTQQPQRIAFLSLLHLGQAYTGLVQDEPFYLAMLVPRLRSLTLALARYLPLDSRQDVFYLSLDEIREMIQNPMNAYKIKELRELIQARKYKRRIAHRLAPESVGELKALELQGRAASRGEVLGRIRLIGRSEDLKHLQPGEIIVTDYFEPFWEQSLSKAGGLILELGGTLSHGAMLARHYELPAVAAVKDATRLLKNGLVARLDGNSGHILAYQEEVLESQEEFVS